jgi:hypothetical protein
MWTRMRQQQQRGAQLPERRRARQAGAAPAEAIRDREAQEHDRADLAVAGGTAQPGPYPASPITSGGDNTPSAPGGEPRARWDDVVQPQRPRGRPSDELPEPEGK